MTTVKADAARPLSEQLRRHEPALVIAMIHVRALPGTPGYGGSLPEVIDAAIEEACLYQDAGVDALAIENMHDTPYLRGAVGPEITAPMAVVGLEVRRATGLRCGVQILAGANREAVAVALAADLDFVRVEGFVFAHVADEGTHQSCAGELLRYRSQIGAEQVLVFTDIKKKHSSHAITADVDIAETARAAELFRSDGVVVTGRSTGEAASVAELEAVRRATTIPLLVGSGVTHENVESYLSRADALIVGSCLKRDGYWENAVDRDRVTRFMEQVARSRS
jgi:membrane complex biogenesis BtpA family protein